ncbi:MAG: hypothetical protein P8X74_16845 [Reinekea sp.]
MACALRRYRVTDSGHDICALTMTSTTIIAGTGTGKLWLNQQPLASHVTWDNHCQIGLT